MTRRGRVGAAALAACAALALASPAAAQLLITSTGQSGASMPAAAQGVPPASGAMPRLTPDAVLQSVDRALPLLEQVRQDVARARGEVTEAQGAFDFKVKAEALTSRGYYDNERAKSVFEQPLAALGMTTYGGYRTSSGLFAPYDGKAATLSDGEVMAGVGLPLLRNRRVDARRTDVRVAEIGVGIAERGLDKARLSYFKEALAEYWDWVAAGQQQRIARALLDIAEARDTQLADAVALGQVAPVERTDNRRAILQRRSALVSAGRQLELQSIDLSLFLRDPSGAPTRPAADLLPDLPRPVAGPDPDEAAEIATALERRPELRAVRLKRDQQEAELRLAENGILPALDLVSEVSRDYGSGPESRRGTVFEAGLAFELPMQRRKASGKSAQIQAKLSALAQELRWTEDRVRADVQDALSARRAARAVLDVVSEEVQVARELEQLERDRFALGDSTQFLVNLRELATADALAREARALADYQKALVSVESATGRLLDRVP